MSNVIYKLDKYSKIPLYYQLNEQILDNIKSGMLKPGDYLPSEEEMCNNLGLSRGTVRQAINNLAEKGYVFRERGKGTQIKPPTLNHDLVGDFSFAKGIRKLGMIPTTKVLEASIGVGKKGITDRLNLNSKAKVFKLSRVRLADNEPWIYEDAYLSADKFPGIEKFDYESNLIIDVLDTEYRTILTNINAYVEPIILDKKFAEILDVKEGISGLVMDRVLFAEESKPIVYSHACIRGDRCRYYFKIAR